jgi:serine/threonine protein kinase/Tfp pilus assembly protein PilF
MPKLVVGSVLDERYEIIAKLGEGGMGAVYQARDRELSRHVALKVIRGDLASDPVILERFKHELILARQVTHRNVIRIYDLGESEGTRFITMEFINGEDLRTILAREHKLTPQDAVEIIKQVCNGLQAAHAEGVIHRDLKPSNIMRDVSGRVVIMDFGLAKAERDDGLTKTGVMLGTVRYMSPEQAIGTPLDARSDVFTVGLILFELMTGTLPYGDESTIATLFRRTRERAIAPSEVDSSIPAEMSRVTQRCLEPDANQRYGSVLELLSDLDSFVKQTRAAADTHPSMRRSEKTPIVTLLMKKPTLNRFAVVLVALVLAFGSGLYLKLTIFGRSGRTTSWQPADPSLAIVPFYNGSSDTSLNWLSSSLSETLSSNLGESQRIRLVSPGRLQQVLKDLHISAQSQLDLSALKRIAEFTNANTIVYGQYSKFGKQIRINAAMYDLKNDRTFELKTDVPSEADLLRGLEQLAAQLRTNLSTDPDIAKDMKNQAPFVLTKSVAGLKAYDEALWLSRSGQHQEAAKMFEEAIDADPNFALAYSKLALSYQKLGFDNKAQQTSRHAVELSKNLPIREKYLIEANHSVVIDDTSKAISAYEKMTQANPEDIDSQMALASLYEQDSRYDEARKRLVLILASDSKNLDALLLSGRLENDAGNPQAALPFLISAYGLAAQFGNDEARAAIEQQMGSAYLGLNQFDEALKRFNAALEIRKDLNLERGVASSLNMIARTEDKLGHFDKALVHFKKSLAGFEKIGDKLNATVVLLNLGAFYGDHARYEEGIKVTNEALTLYRDLDDQADQALCLNNLGTLHRYLGNLQTALTYYQQSYQIREKLKLSADTAESLYNLADLNADLGQYDVAITQYLRALEIRRASGDQVEVAINSSGLGALYAMQGKYGSALSALQDALNGLQQSKDKTWVSAEALANYGNVLSEVGRWDDGRKYLEEAIRIATDVKNDGILAEVLAFKGDSYFYSGQYNAARQHYSHAMLLASKVKNQSLIVRLKFNFASIDVMQNHPAAAIPVLKGLVQETETIGLKRLSVKGSIYLAQASAHAAKLQDAQHGLEGASIQAEKLGLQVEIARAHYLLGQVLRQRGKTNEYLQLYQEATRILDGIRKEPGAEQLLNRSDLRDLYRDAAD